MSKPKKETPVVEAEEEQPAEEIAEQTEGEAIEEGAEGDKDAEIEALRAENAKLKNSAPAAQIPARVTAAQLRGFTPEQKKAAEAQFQVPFEDIVREVETHELRNENADVKARLNVTEALEDAQSEDPKVHSLKPHMKAYLARLPLEVRADPTRLKEEIAHAKIYARGKIASGAKPPITPKAGGGKLKTPQTPSPDDEDSDPEPEMPEGQIKSGSEFVAKDGSFKLKVGVSDDELPKAKRAKIQHPTDVNGVQFGREEAPRFNRG